MHREAVEEGADGVCKVIIKTSIRRVRSMGKQEEIKLIADRMRETTDKFTAQHEGYGPFDLLASAFLFHSH